ncbi:synaptic vesicle glycoprotein 2C [Octopus bimaculoides]|nr:synaptic vesicle glycoprotein 2C [Octopus bimaculoides]
MDWRHDQSGRLLETQNLLESDASDNESVTKDNKPDSTSYEDALEATGNGIFNYLLTFICGWAVSSDAIEIMSLSFVLPSTTCDFNISEFNVAILNSSMFVGMLIGGYMWGIIADEIGRRKVLLCSLTINGVAGLVSSVAQEFWLFTSMRFISGIGVGGSVPVVFSYFIEFQPKKRRGAMVSLLASFWMSGTILAAGLAWFIIPYTHIDIHLQNFVYTNWRLYLSVCVIPSLTSVIFFFLLPESPKFLLSIGDETEALAILKLIYKKNHKRAYGHKYQVFSLRSLKDSNSSKHSSTQSTITGKLKHTMKNTTSLFKNPLLYNSVALMIISFTLSFGYYGLSMWFPSMFNKIEKYGGSICSPGKPTNATVNLTCQEPNSDIYFDGFLTAVSNLPGNILSMMLVDRIGRKILLVVSMVISGLSVFFIWLVKTKVQSLALSCLFGGISVIGWNSLDTISSEIFPTQLRSTGLGVQTATLRIGAILGNLVFGILINAQCAIPMLLTSGLLLLGGLLAIKLPDLTGKDLS